MSESIPATQTNSEDAITRIQARIPDPLWRRVKSKAALTGRSAEDITAEALEAWLVANAA